MLVFHKSHFSGHYFGRPMFAWTFERQTNRDLNYARATSLLRPLRISHKYRQLEIIISWWLECSWTLKTIKAQYPIWLGLDPKWISFLQIKETISNQGWKIHFHFFSKSPQLFAQKGPISDLALFSTETDSLSLFVEIPPIVLANTSKYIFFSKLIPF